MINLINLKNLKKINLVILTLVLSLLGYFVYQSISISSGNISLVNLKKEFLDVKNSDSVGLVQEQLNFDPVFIKENFRMAEIEKFDYIFIGPSDFVLIEGTKLESRQ